MCAFTIRLGRRAAPRRSRGFCGLCSFSPVTKIRSLRNSGNFSRDTETLSPPVFISPRGRKRRRRYPGRRRRSPEKPRLPPGARDLFVKGVRVSLVPLRGLSMGHDSNSTTNLQSRKGDAPASRSEGRKYGIDRWRI